MAIPVIALDYGRKLSTEEAQVVIEQKIKQNDEFKEIIAKLDQFNEKKIEVLAANKFEFIAQNEESVTFGISVVIESGNSIISYLSSTKDGRESEVVTAAIQNDISELTTLAVLQGEVVETEFNHFGEAIAERDFSEGLPNQDDYIEGQSLDIVKAQYNWGDGCYPLYKHCGRNCGDNGDYGGGTPKNPYDTCCRTHDRCWANFGTNDCGCDCDLIACAKRNWTYAPPALHAILLAYFPVKSTCKC